MRFKKRGSKVSVFGGRIKYYREAETTNVIAAINGAGATLTPTKRLAASFIIGNFKSIKDSGETQSVWDRTPCVYGLLGGVAAAHKFNWKNPVDTDGAYRLTLNGGITHSDNGMKFDGSSGYANTHFLPSGLTAGSAHMSFYSDVEGVTAGLTDMGCFVSPGGVNDFRLIIRRSDNTAYAIFSNSTGSDIVRYSQTNSIGNYIGNIKSNSISFVKNGAPQVSDGGFSSGTGFPNVELLIGAAWSGTEGSLSGMFSPKRCGFATIGAGLTVNEISPVDNSIRAYRKFLGGTL